MSTGTDRGRRTLWISVAVGAAVVLVLAVVLWNAVAGSREGGQTSPPGTSATGPSNSSPTLPSTDLPPVETSSAPPVLTPVEVGLDAPAEPLPGVTTRVTAVEAVQGEGAPGETSGPAVRVSVTIDNGSAEDLSLAGTTVNLSYGDVDSPASPVSGPGVVAFPVSVPTGQATTGVFVFTVPVEERARISVTLDVSAGAPMVVFVGVGPTS